MEIVQQVGTYKEGAVLILGKKLAQKLSWQLRMKIAIDIAKGMAYLHSRSPPVLHRDLKSPNVLLAATSEDAVVVAKVSDFGASCKLYIESLKAESANTRTVNNPSKMIFVSNSA